ncbi:hypothetical protein FACS1894181_18080 [Bacteroidia bacterium]|nr:hypothetical protein FACS1894181_18080 [Bacteroidia bacterium]
MEIPEIYIQLAMPKHVKAILAFKLFKLMTEEQFVDTMLEDTKYDKLALTTHMKGKNKSVKVG